MLLNIKEAIFSVGELLPFLSKSSWLPLALFAMACVRRTKQWRHVEQDKDNDVNYSNFDHFLSLNIFKQNVLEHCDNDHYEKQWYDYHMIIIIFSGIIHVLGGRAVGHTLVSACISELFWNIFSHYL